MTNKVLRACLLAGFVAAGCKPNVSDVKSGKALQYGHKGETLPIKWNLAGATRPDCSTRLTVPQNVVDDLSVAWSQANDLLLTPLDQLQKQTTGDFLLNDVSLVLGSERVLVFNGCIGSKPDEASPTTSPRPPIPVEATTMSPQAQGGISSTCEELSDVILSLKSPARMQPTANCGSPAMVAGFAMRSAARDVALTAYFNIKGASRTYKMEPFEINTVEINGGAGASITSFGAAMLPLPGPVKAAATAVLDRIGSGSFAVLLASTNTVIPDNSYRKVAHPSGVGTMRVSKLAENIAKNILRPACRDAAQALGTLDPRKCELRSVEGAFGAAEALEQYRSLPVVNCESRGATEKYLYALAHKPNTGAGEPDFLVHTGATPSKLSVYHQESGPVGTYLYKSWTTYLGPVNDVRKCGSFDANKYRCVVVTSGGTADGLGNCGSGVRRKLSLLTAPKIN